MQCKLFVNIHVCLRVINLTLNCIFIIPFRLDRTRIYSLNSLPFNLSTHSSYSFHCAYIACCKLCPFRSKQAASHTHTHTHSMRQHRKVSLKFALSLNCVWFKNASKLTIPMSIAASLTMPTTRKVPLSSLSHSLSLYRAISQSLNPSLCSI